MRGIARFLGFLFATGAIVFVIGAGLVAAVIWKFEQDLPDYSQLKNYEPPVMTRVHAADGSLLAEYARERRLYLPSSAIPPLVKQAFISAEDKNFYTAADVGFIAQNVYLYCASEGLATAVRGSIDKAALAQTMKLRPDQKIILAQAVGYPKK